MSMVEDREVVQNTKEKCDKRKMLLGVLVTLFFLVGCLVWWFLQGKAVGTIRVPEIHQKESVIEKMEKKLYQGKFITFFHGSGYMETSHYLSESGPVRESLFLSTLDVEGRKIAVTVAYRGTRDLESEPAFQFRQGTPEEYRSKNFQEGIWQGVVFEKNTAPFERTLFLEKSGYILSISVTSPFSGDDIEDELRMIVRDLSFSFE